MKTFREQITEMEDGQEEFWAKEDLINLIRETVLDEDDLNEISELVLEIAEYDMDDEDDIFEKMSNDAKRKAKKDRKKPAFKKAMRLKKKCMSINGDRVRKSDGKLTCSTSGKVVKGMSKADRRKLKKTRLKNKSKIIK